MQESITEAGGPQMRYLICETQGRIYFKPFLGLGESPERNFYAPS